MLERAGNHGAAGLMASAFSVRQGRRPHHKGINEAAIYLPSIGPSPTVLSLFFGGLHSGAAGDGRTAQSHEEWYSGRVRRALLRKCSIFLLDVAIPGKVSLRWCLPLSSAASPLDRMVLLKWYRQYVDEAFLMLSRLDMSCCP